MWYVKHPFDCIVVGSSAVRDGRGPHPAGVHQPDCQGQGGGEGVGGGGVASSRTQPFGYWGKRPSCSRADVRAEECGKQSTLGGLVL